MSRTRLLTIALVACLVLVLTYLVIDLNRQNQMTVCLEGTNRGQYRHSGLAAYSQHRELRLAWQPPGRVIKRP